MTTGVVEKKRMEEALNSFKQLTLSSSEDQKAGCSGEQTSEAKKTEEVEEDEERLSRSRSFSIRHPRSRYAPYRLPSKRASSCGSRECVEEESDESVANSSRATSKSSSRPTTTCTQEALGICKEGQESNHQRGSSVGEQPDVEELSEYFAHFVGVQTKMSPLAESMYA